MLHHPLTGLAAFTALICVSYLVLFHTVPTIDAWEAANGYPYGKICAVYGVCE